MTTLEKRCANGIFRLRAERIALFLAFSLAMGCDADRSLSPKHFSAAGLSRAGSPGTPVDLSANPASTSQINLAWGDNANGETGWEIHRSTTGINGEFSLLTKTSANVTTYSDGGLDASTEYCYKVRSYKTTGKKTSFSNFLSPACATTNGPPLSPTNVKAVPSPGGIIDVQWQFAGTTESGAIVERAVPPKGPTLCANPSECPWESVMKFDYRTNAFHDVGRVVEVTVCYRITAINAFGVSKPSPVACTAPPQAPTSISASSTDANSIDVSWTDDSNVEDGYSVERTLDVSPFVWGEIGVVAANINTIHDPNVTSDTRYWYRVRAKRDGGYSDYSPWVSAIAVTAPPAIPTGLNATPNSSSVVYVVWDQGSLTTEGFRLERSVAGGDWVLLTTTQGRYGSWTDGGLTSEQEVCYRVSAFNRAGPSLPSAPDCTTPPAAPSEIELVPIDDQSVELRWKDNSNVEDSYEIWFIVYCDPYGCYQDPWYYSVTVPANTQSYIVSASETVDGVIATKDGGYSDWGTWKATASVMSPTAKAQGRPMIKRSPTLLRRSPNTANRQRP